MLGLAFSLAEEFSYDHYSVMKVHPIDDEIINSLRGYDTLVILEEHCRVGGLCSALLDNFVLKSLPIPNMRSLSLNSSFAINAGSHQYALSEHSLDDRSVRMCFRSLLDLID